MENTSFFRNESLSGLPEVHHIHFIGILGAGMRLAAHMAHDLGYAVSGSDKGAPPSGTRLDGIAVTQTGEMTSGIFTADLAVFSLAIAEDDSEVLVAKARGILLASRADFFGALMRPYGERIGIAGTHGKSTVTAMCADMLSFAGCDPTVAVGADLLGGSDGYRAGGREYLVFEACEYKHSFLSFCPSVAVLLNAEWDHPDCFADHAAILDAFHRYLSLPSVRVAVLSADDTEAALLAQRLSVPIVTFGRSETADIRADELLSTEGGVSFLLSVCGRSLGRVFLSVLGEHNVQNALAAYAVAYALGISPNLHALSDFSGIGRRTQYRGKYGGAIYYDDYAHHPTEIRAGLSSLGGRGRLIAVFQPHTYSRTAALFSELCSALREADLVIVTDIYAAREKNESGITARALASAIGPRAVYMPTPETAALAVRVRAKAGDTVLVMGAGDLSKRFFCGPLSF